MKTKKVELWCDLSPGWQDTEPNGVWVSNKPMAVKYEGNRRVKITVDLPCFGGSAEQDDVVTGKSEIVN